MKYWEQGFSLGKTCRVGTTDKSPLEREVEALAADQQRKANFVSLSEKSVSFDIIFMVAKHKKQ